MRVAIDAEKETVETFIDAFMKEEIEEVECLR